MKKRFIALMLSVATIISTVSIATTTTKAAKLNGWVSSNNHWNFYKSGNKVTGWLSDSKNWYFMDNKGVMKTGWQSINGKWYFLTNSGAMKTGWLSDGKQWYFLNNSGAMQIGWKQENGKWYFLNNSGQMARGWGKINNVWYLFNGSGEMQTGWKLVGGKWYFLANSGAMATGRQVIGGVTHLFNESGAWLGEVKAFKPQPKPSIVNPEVKPQPKPSVVNPEVKPQPVKEKKYLSNEKLENLLYTEFGHGEWNNTKELEPFRNIFKALINGEVDNERVNKSEFLDKNDPISKRNPNVKDTMNINKMWKEKSTGKNKNVYNGDSTIYKFEMPYTENIDEISKNLKVERENELKPYFAKPFKDFKYFAKRRSAYFCHNEFKVVRNGDKMTVYAMILSWGYPAEYN